MTDCDGCEETSGQGLIPQIRAIYATPELDPTTVGGSAPRSNETRYRVGRSVGRTLYENGKLFGLVDTAEQAQRIVAALTSQPASTNSQTWEFVYCPNCPGVAKFIAGITYRCPHCAELSEADVPVDALGPATGTEEADRD